MTGLLLLAVFAVWLSVTYKVARLASGRVSNVDAAFATGVLVFSVLLVLPVLDELIGGFQFRQLCRGSDTFDIGVSDPEGRTTRYSANPSNALVPGTLIDIYETKVEYRDVHTDERVVSFTSYVAKGGWFVKAIGVFSNPLTIGSPSCSPEQGVTVSRTLKFSVAN